MTIGIHVFVFPRSFIPRTMNTGIYEFK